MIISRRFALVAGICAICTILLMHAYVVIGCNKGNFSDFVSLGMIFLGLPLLLAIISLALRNPLPGVGACAFLAPWLVMALHADCIQSYSGGGASMSYVAVLLWGTPSSIVGAILTAVILRILKMRIESGKE